MVKILIDMCRQTAPLMSRSYSSHDLQLQSPDRTIAGHSKQLYWFLSLSQYLGDWSEDDVAKFSKLMNKCQQREKQMMK